MPKFLIEWGIRDHIFIADVIEAETVEDAIREADRQAEDLWESNKIATAKPYRDKTDERRPTDGTVRDHGGVPDVHASRGGAGGGV